MSRRVILKSLGWTSLVTATGGSAFLLSIKTTDSQKQNSLQQTALRRKPNGDIIPPTFPKVKSRTQQIADLRRSSSTDASLSPSSTQNDTIYDLLIIGGGATGTGIALDAATRGLKVALVERDDFASGTSSKSTKLVHGGVRYLEKAVWNLDYGQYSLVKEALRERKSFLNNAPHLASSLPILLPIQKWWQAPYFWAGTKAYDLLAGSQGLESSYFLSRKRALETFPMLKDDLNDARMNVSLALTAALYGATTVNHMEVTGLEKDKSGRICGAKVRDLLSDTAGEDAASSSNFTIRARGVINAAGPFVDAIEHMDDPKRKELVSPAEGVHVVLPRHFGPQNNIGLLDASTSDGRVMFLLPWEGNIVAGTTDTACKVTDTPSAKESDISFILKEVSKHLSPSINLQRSDVLAAWSGIRPLMRDPNSTNTESLVRNHLITVSPSGLLTCAGGKWTTYRQMSEDAVDAAIEAFSLNPRAFTPAQIPQIAGVGYTKPQTLDGTCATHELPVIGAHGYHPFLHIDLVRAYPDTLTPETAMHLARSYGDRAWIVASQYNTAEKLTPKYPFVHGEVDYAIENEYTETATDFLARRTRLSFLDVEEAVSCLPVVVQRMSQALGWSENRVEKEWRDTMFYLRSMGLDQSRWDLTMDDVLAERAGQKTLPSKRPIPQTKAAEITIDNEPLTIAPVTVDMPVAATASTVVVSS
ncbi:Glycerol-3-phosphate dehydrogenase, mitochondrial [Cyphellophora attinorum]|uniref:Glycerol-3-phosphate dehydrogenase n=1 Tax=Cyphellophora attinorum TaxID=1664694 RepID=A0A0N0NQ65_9EURO|nr:Glycerol-3-phosphate dehydrogenase, mitochondrial [Phialophora attinorum]KPI43548.1 Glycerol-3-phosphate dehydrogenase, mitochondrial [Phialophora attinorum]